MELDLTKPNKYQSSTGYNNKEEDKNQTFVKKMKKLTLSKNANKIKRQGYNPDLGIRKYINNLEKKYNLST